MELALIAMVRMRHNRCGLALNEWGRTSLSPDRAPAGAKRLGNLLRSSRWTHDLPEELLRKGADRRLMELEAAGETALAIRDESALEDPQSKALEGLYPARSSKAARLKRIKPGYYHPTGDRRYSCQGCDGYQRNGHIPGAPNVPWGQDVNANGAFKSADELSELYGGKGMDGSRETIACCRIGERSSHTWFVLSQLLGYDNVRNCDGSWTERGGIVGAPIERDV